MNDKSLQDFHGACTGMDPNLWGAGQRLVYMSEQERLEGCIEVCRGCDVIVECLERYSTHTPPTDVPHDMVVAGLYGEPLRQAIKNTRRILKVR